MSPSPEGAAEVRRWPKTTPTQPQARMMLRTITAERRELLAMFVPSAGRGWIFKVCAPERDFQAVYHALSSPRAPRSAASLDAGSLRRVENSFSPRLRKKRVVWEVGKKGRQSCGLPWPPLGEKPPPAFMMIP